MANSKVLEEFEQAIEGAKKVPKEALMFTYKGVTYPHANCDVETFKTIETFEAREEDLMMVSYPKCGCNWTLLLLHSIVYAAYKKPPASIVPLIEFKAPNKFEKLKADPSPRIIASHMSYDNIPQSFIDKRVKMLVTYRNPKDAAVSLFHFYNMNPMLPSYDSWDEFFQDFIAGKVIYGSYFDHAVAWNKHLDEDTIMLMTFEDMKENLEEQVKKMCEFFGISLPEEEVKQIAEKGTFKSMKENSGKTHGVLAPLIFRKGEIGDWKNYFSEAQSQEVDAKFEECLAGTKLGERLNYNVHCKW
ncbi:sulfotransferase 6B1-like [Dendropsophus ebraccatus]|uniref:sulfotransferase 6B1-like n=1 Tax=Dendropsophus ebraccatus TaxID=150705 RepID=UPI003831BAAD